VQRAAGPGTAAGSARPRCGSRRPRRQARNGTPAARDPQTNVTDDDVITTAKIARAHLNEFPDYYTRLAKMEAEAEAERDGNAQDE
jgi:uncharacterized protein DUF5661